MKAFETAVAAVLKAEGGFVDDHADHGGPTNFGITMGALSAHRGATVTVEDVRTMSRAEAEAIYLTEYWEPAGLDLLKSEALATVLFDQVVNHGPQVALRMLQRALQSIGTPGLGVDGVMGPATARAANTAPERLLTIRLIVLAQTSYLDICKADPTQTKFLRGWLARTWRLFEVLA